MKIEFITATCNTNTINNNLCLTTHLWPNYPLNVIMNSTHLTKDIQEGIDKSNADIVCVIHDDVRLIEGFEYNLLKSLDKLNKDYPDWAVAGVAGADWRGVIAHIIDRQNILGSHIETPIPVDTIDEVLVLINTKHRLRLDEDITTHHLWATDLCLQAKEKELECYVIEALVHHNSTNNYVLGEDYYKQVEYIKSKWSHMMPFNTTCYNFREVK